VRSECSAGGLTSLREKWSCTAVERTGIGMEHLSSQAGATGGNPSQTHPPKKRLRSADRQPVATPRNKQTFDGKERVDPRSREMLCGQQLGSKRMERLRSPMRVVREHNRKTV
jgi:hypothetical protein